MNMRYFNDKSNYNKFVPATIRIFNVLLLMLAFLLFFKHITTNIIMLIAAFAISWFLCKFVHELGHLCVGAISKYKFISLQIYTILLIIKNNRIQLKLLPIREAQFQCLMRPTNASIVFYSLGGTCSNIIFLLINIMFLFYVDGYLVSIIVWWNICINVLTIFDNAIPFITDDGPNDMMTIILVNTIDYYKESLFDYLDLYAKIANDSNILYPSLIHEHVQHIKSQ